jgi:hypothetical protein
MCERIARAIVCIPCELLMRARDVMKTAFHIPERGSYSAAEDRAVAQDPGNDDARDASGGRALARPNRPRGNRSGCGVEAVPPDITAIAQSMQKLSGVPAGPRKNFAGCRIRGGPVPAGYQIRTRSAGAT